jgi:hypothetical protein
MSNNKSIFNYYFNNPAIVYNENPVNYTTSLNSKALNSIFLFNNTIVPHSSDLSLRIDKDTFLKRSNGDTNSRC